MQLFHFFFFFLVLVQFAGIYQAYEAIGHIIILPVSILIVMMRSKTVKRKKLFSIITQFMIFRVNLPIVLILE